MNFSTATFLPSLLTSPLSGLGTLTANDSALGGSTGSLEQLIGAQDDAMSNPDFQPNNGVTHCNQATAAIAESVGAPMNPFVDGQGTPLLANDQAQNLANSQEYRQVSAEDAQAIADSGGFAVAASVNPGGHGHIATVRPEGVAGDDPFGRRGPLFNNIGSHNGIRHESASFHGTPTYYVPVDSVTGTQAE